MIRLCYGDVTGLLDPLVQERCLALIPRECRERILKIRSDKARAGTLGARVLLARCLKDMGLCLAEESFVYGTFGKPGLRDHPQICFNLSHSGAYAACTVSDQAAGVDIQRLDGLHPQVQRRCFTRRERQYVQEAVDPTRTFALIWAMKESFVKASGTGLTENLQTVETDPDTMSVSGSPLRFRQWNVQGYVLVLCAGELPENVERMCIG